MFGTVFRARPKPGKYDEFVQAMRAGDQRQIKGFIRAYTLREANGDAWVTVIFEDEASYRANAASPEQDAEYQKFRALLEADPEWHDGEIHEST